MNRTHDLAVVTLTRGRPDYVEALVRDVAEQEVGAGLQVLKILVNNEPSDKESADIALRAGWTVMTPGFNASFSDANNMAARFAAQQGVSHLWLLNNDARTQPGCLAALWAARAKADVLGCLIIQDDGRVNHAGARLLPWPDHLDRGADPASLPRAGFRPTDAVTFASVLIATDVFVGLMGFDERFVWSFEDTDFCARVREAGGTIGIEYGAVVHHNECGTRERGGAYDSKNGQLFHAVWIQTGRLRKALEK